MLVGALKSLPGTPREFEFRELKKATNSFDEKNKLGQGGYGVVYRGVLVKENLEIAVKMFSRESIKGQDDFLAELTIINRLRHRHLVKLLVGQNQFLIQDDVGGLEVSKDGEWVLVNPLSDAIVVILADQTEIITNGQYKSSQHRAITNAKKSRLSVATFHDPAKSKIINPAFEPPKYRPAMYGDYVSSWYTKGPEDTFVGSPILKRI